MNLSCGLNNMSNTRIRENWVFLSGSPRCSNFGLLEDLSCYVELWKGAHISVVKCRFSWSYTRHCRVISRSGPHGTYNIVSHMKQLPGGQIKILPLKVCNQGTRNGSGRVWRPTSSPLLSPHAAGELLKLDMAMYLLVSPKFFYFYCLVNKMFFFFFFPHAL